MSIEHSPFTPTIHSSLSPAQSCLPDHLSHSMKFLSMKEFLSALSTCRSWNTAAQLNSSWPSEDDIDASIDRRLDSIDPWFGLPFRGIYLSHRSGTNDTESMLDRLRLIQSHRIAKRIQTVLIADHMENEFDLLAGLPGLTELSLLAGNAPKPEIRSALFESLAQRQRLRRLILQSHWMDSIRMICNIYTLGELILRAPKSHQITLITPTAIRNLTQLQTLAIKSWQSNNPGLSIEQCLAIRWLSIHGHLRRLEILQSSPMAIAALAHPPHRLKDGKSSHIILPSSASAIDTFPYGRLGGTDYMV